TNDVRNRKWYVLDDRSYFGKLEVSREEEGDKEYHKLVHGTTLHGKQQVSPPSDEPLTYYHRTGPLGQVFRALGVPQQVAAVGLGTGSVAAYGQPGMALTFYEIDRAVRRIAENPKLFTYLKDCKAGRLDFVMGDARLKLEEQGRDG